MLFLTIVYHLLSGVLSLSCTETAQDLTSVCTFFRPKKSGRNIAVLIRTPLPDIFRDDFFENLPED